MSTFTGEPERARAAFRRALEIDPEFAPALAGLATLTANTGDLDASLKSYKTALRLDRKHLGANAYIGELYLMMNNLSKANKYLKKLNKYCGDCEQYQDLKAAVEQHQANS